MILLICAIGLITYVVLYYQNVRKYPPGPFPLPLIGNLYHLKAEGLHEYIHKIGPAYGHCLTLFLPRPIVFLTNYDNVYEALVTKGDNFAGRSQLPPDIYLQRNLQTGVTIADGDKWRTQRRISVKILRELGMGKNGMEAKINQMLDELMHMLKETNNGVTSFDICKPLQQFAGNTINEVLFGYHFKFSEPAKFEFFLERACEHLRNIKYNVFAFIVQAWPWAKSLPIIGRKGYTEPTENMSLFNGYVEEEVDQIVKTYDRHHEPSNFVEAYLSEMEKNAELDIINLCAIVVDIWFAGAETTGRTLRWCPLILMQNPAAQEKMRAELISVVGKDRRLEMADKPNLPYFNAAMAELQRTANLLPFILIHRCTADTTIGGKPIPKDTLTRHQIFSVMRDDEIFKNPIEFKPERFMGEDGKVNKILLDRVVPFGMGKRQCMGEGLARMELFLVLGNLLLNYRFEQTESFDSINNVLRDPGPYKCRIVPIYRSCNNNEIINSQ
ncbi:hypothetical protein PMAYCL1PPCAC_10897 [Pristionchus mayeri]|uniref:Cytochrome P450 n=1 Tax=Pristionchus mayeri TaxID=1317129 RepID=A0AAN4ZGE2_9BILA|nr:hypothetical protein PMAYCL1PPCAC_10897 [Pristionchus mayeri]